MADTKLEVDVVAIKTALIGLDERGGLVKDVRDIKHKLDAQDERITVIDGKATRAIWWSRLPFAGLVALAAILGTVQYFA